LEAVNLAVCGQKKKISESGFNELNFSSLRPSIILQLGSREPYGLRPKEKMSESFFDELNFSSLKTPKKQSVFIAVKLLTVKIVFVA